MKTLALAVLIAVFSTPVYAEPGVYRSTTDFIKAYDKDNNNIYLRIYLHGVTDGLQTSNAWVENNRGGLVYCPPENVGLVDAQYVEIMKSYLTKFPKNKSGLPAVILLFALKDAFPCKE
jgi:hypothetical protein